MRKLRCFPQNDVQSRERSSCHSWAISKISMALAVTENQQALRIMYIMH